MKKKFVCLLLTLLLFACTACDRREQDPIIYMKISNGFEPGWVINYTRESQITYPNDLWNYANSRFFVKEEAPETVTLTIGEETYTASYTGSHSYPPDFTYTDHYSGERSAGSFQFHLDNKTGTLVYFDTPHTLESKNRITKQEARAIADRIAADLIPLEDYEVQYTGNDARPQFTYTRQVCGVEIYGRVVITLTADGQLVTLNNSVTPAMQDWIEKTPEKEKEAFVRRCASEEMREKVFLQLLARVEEPFDRTSNVQFYQNGILLLPNGKPAMYHNVHITIFRLDEEAKMSRGSSEFYGYANVARSGADVLVYDP